MAKILLLILLFTLTNNDPAFSQDKIKNETRGTIRVKKAGPTKYFISAKTSLKEFPPVRVFRVRGFNFNFNEYFPRDYDSELFPLVFNYRGLILTNEKREYSSCEIISFEYEIFKSNVLYMSGTATQSDLSFPIRKISEMMTGSCIWIKNLSYKDKDGKLHKNEIGEFRIEKVK